MPLLRFNNHVCDQCGFAVQTEVDGPQPEDWMSLGFSSNLGHVNIYCSWLCLLQFVAAQIAAGEAA